MCRLAPAHTTHAVPALAVHAFTLINNSMATAARPTNRRSITVKLFVIATLVGLLLIPSFMIGVLVEDRQDTRDAAIREISQTWGEPQQIVGPILTVPYRRYHLDTAGRRTTFMIAHAQFLPEELSIACDVGPEVRYRGIYQAVLYSAEAAITGTFARPAFERMNVRPEDVIWSEASVTMGISDMSGVRDRVMLVWDGVTHAFEPGTRESSLVESGVSVSPGAAAFDTTRKSYAFSIRMSVNGSQRISFVPIGRVTSAEVRSTWDNPSFDGAFLPIERAVSANGFNARWRILDLNRNFPQVIQDEEIELSHWSFGASLLLPVDSYHQTTRSVKYAVLFIVLTFLAFFLIEVMQGMRVHAIQYLLVGSALVVFYLLLLALSEYIAFSTSYLIASSATVLLTVLYVASVFRRATFAAVIGTVLVALYAYLYVLLQLQDYSLLLGSVGLFVILAAVMYLTRRIDWYSLDFASTAPETGQAVAQRPAQVEFSSDADTEAEIQP